MEDDILQAIQDGCELQTRWGRPVRIYATDGGGGYPIHGAIQIGESWISRSWSKDGLQCEGMQNDVDLIVKPRTIELDLWINVYPDGAFSAFTAREVADGFAGSNRIACISLKRTVTEGEGL